MNTLTGKLRALLKKYGFRSMAELNGRTLFCEGTEIPLFPWRRERRFAEMRNIVQSEYFVSPSMYRAGVFAEKTEDTDEVTARELDLFEFVMRDEISEIFSVRNGAARNLLLLSKKGIVGVIEIGASVKKGERTDKHEAISSSGIVCDRAVDTQIRQDSVYLLGGKTETYTDTDFELYGLDERETACVRAAFDFLTEREETDLCAREAYLKQLIGCVRASEEKNCNVAVKTGVCQ